MSNTETAPDAARTERFVPQAIRDEESRRWALIQAIQTLAQGHQLPASITAADIANRAAVFLQSIRPDLPFAATPEVTHEPARVTPLRVVPPQPA